MPWNALSCNIFFPSENKNLFTDSPPVPPSERRQSRVSFDQNVFPVCCRNKQRNFTTNQASCSRNTQRRWRSSVWKFYQIKLCLFDLNLSIKQGENFFVYKCKLSFLSLALVYLVDLVINKLKTKFNNLFYRKILKWKKEFTTPFEEISPQELNKCLQKFYLSARKSDDRGRSVIARQDCNRRQQ